MALAALFWFYLTPSAETTKTLAPGWIAYLLARNAILVFVIYGLLELRLYMKRGQATRFKFNAKWPADNGTSTGLNLGSAARFHQYYCHSNPDDL